MIPNALLNPDRFYKNNGDGTFAEIANQVGINNTGISRGMATADFDNDGDIDVIAAAADTSMGSSQHAILYRNDYSGNNNWLDINLVGEISIKDAIGHQLEIKVGDQCWIHEVVGGRSYSSQSSSIAHFGLGSKTKADSLIINFPSGIQKILTNISANQKITVHKDFNQGIQHVNLPQINIFQNPSRGNLNFQMSAEILSGKIEITNLEGQIVYSSSAKIGSGENILTIDLSVSQGLYHVKFLTNNNLYRGIINIVKL